MLFCLSFIGGIRPVERVLTSRVETELCSTQSAPRDTITSVVQAAKRALKEEGHKLYLPETTSTSSSFHSAHPESGHFGQEVLLGDLHLVHEDHTCGRGSQRELPFDLWRRQTLHASFQDEATDLPVVTFGPDNSDVCHRGVGDPEGGRTGNVREKPEYRFILVTQGKNKCAVISASAFLTQ